MSAIPQQEGYVVDTAMNGEEAISKSEEKFL
jgi:CheY-like chemotaxis protein